MKKILLSICSIITVFSAFSQDTITFESINLSPESFDNGSSGSGGFSFGNANFSNDYNASWGSWSGFLISNTTDNTTAGYMNEQSAFTGGGNNSATYGIYYSYDNTGLITFDTPGAILQSMRITNSTFAALSMRDGDFVGKQFGSIYNANGDVDGTNGEDFLKIWIYAYNSANQIIDSMDYYLADYRFSDNNLDYIIDQWELIDLTQLTDQTVFKLSFSFESSDIGAWGINTPTYFALDDIVYNKNVGIVENSISKIEIYPNPIQDFVTVKGENGTLTLSDINGNVILSQAHFQKSTLDTRNLSQGVYFIELKNSKGRTFQKVIK